MSEKLEVGSIVEGKVVRVKPFGAIVSLGKVQGLVHISQLSHKFIKHPLDAVKVGDIVEFSLLYGHLLFLTSREDVNIIYDTNNN